MRINEITNYGAVPKGTDKISTKQNITTRTTQAPSGRSSEKVSTRNIRNTQNTGTTDVFKRSVTTTNPDNTRSKHSSKTLVRPDNTFSTTTTKTDAKGNKTVTKNKGYDSIFKHRPQSLKDDANVFKKGASDAETAARNTVRMHNKIDAKLANTPSIAKTKQYKDYKKGNQQRKTTAMKQGMPYGRQDGPGTGANSKQGGALKPIPGLKK